MNSLMISVLVRSVLFAKASKMRSSCSGILIFNCFSDMLRVRVGMLYCVCGFIVGCIRLYSTGWLWLTCGRFTGLRLAHPQ